MIWFSAGLGWYWQAALSDVCGAILSKYSTFVSPAATRACDDGLDVALDRREIGAAQERADDADDQRARVLGAHRLQEAGVGGLERRAGIALVVADVVGPEVDDHRLGLGAEVPGRRGVVRQRPRVDHRQRVVHVAAVVAVGALARHRDRVHLGAERARRDGAVGVPVALGREAVAVGQRAERAVAAADRIADDLDEARGRRRRGHQRAASDGQAEELGVTLRALGLAVELDRVRPGAEAGDHAGGLLPGGNRERRPGRAVDDRLEDERAACC